MEAYVELGADGVPADRGFTGPDRTRADLVVVREMAAALWRLVAAPLPAAPRPLALDAARPGERPHRVVVCDGRRLRAALAPGLVGFFAERRPGLDHAPLTAADDELILELPAHPGILSYSSLELADGNWANLILVDPPEARELWRSSPKHAWAAGELAPRHYTVVRIHLGYVPGGVLGGGEPVLTRTRYFDYRGPTPWAAERALTPRA